MIVMRLPREEYERREVSQRILAKVGTDDSYGNPRIAGRKQCKSEKSSKIEDEAVPRVLRPTEEMCVFRRGTTSRHVSGQGQPGQG